jgi:hypothetical protein
MHSVYLLKKSIAMQCQLSRYDLLLHLVMYAASLFKIGLYRFTVMLSCKHEQYKDPLSHETRLQYISLGN